MSFTRLSGERVVKAAKTVMEKNTDHRLAPAPGAKNTRPIPKKAAGYRLTSHETM
jgi:hypothetical protein